MADLKIAQKKDWAKLLYTKENLTQAEIADRVGVTRVTVNKWINNEKWDLLKSSITIGKEAQLSSLYRQLNELNNAILTREDKARYAYPAEAQIISKLAEAIKKLETEAGVADIIGVGKRFIEFLRPIDLEMAKEFTRLFDLFIKQNL
jgi:transcriptional regulator with XRE-family HTH domain